MRYKKSLEEKIWPITTSTGGGIGFLVSCAKMGYEAITGDYNLDNIYSYISPIIHGAGWGYFIGSGIDTVKYFSKKIKKSLQK